MNNYTAVYETTATTPKLSFRTTGDRFISFPKNELVILSQEDLDGLLKYSFKSAVEEGIIKVTTGEGLPYSIGAIKETKKAQPTQTATVPPSGVTTEAKKGDKK